MNDATDLTVEQELEEIDRLANLAYDTYAEEQVLRQYELAEEAQHGALIVQGA